jgi:hypothetical protein
MGIQAANENDEIEMLKLQAFAMDALTTMDKQKMFETGFFQSDAQLQQSLTRFLNNTTPENVNAKITVKMYRYETHSSCGSCHLAGNTPINGFCLCRSVSSDTVISNTVRQKTVEKRMFSTHSERQMGMATIEVSLK